MKFLIAGALVELMASFVVVLAPYGPRSVWSVRFSVIAAFIVCMIPVFLQLLPRDNPKPDTRIDFLRKVSLFAMFSVLVYFPVTQRETRTEIIGPSFRGAVSDKYRSSNHGYLSLEIKRSNGETMTLESVDENVWANAKIGDLFDKDAWSPYASIGGRVQRLISASWLDSLRGLPVQPPPPPPPPPTPNDP